MLTQLLITKSAQILFCDWMIGVSFTSGREFGYEVHDQIRSSLWLPICNRSLGNLISLVLREKYNLTDPLLEELEYWEEVGHESLERTLQKLEDMEDDRAKK